MVSETELIRLLQMLHGEASESDSAELRHRMETDEELRRAFERFSRVWDDLQPPPPSIVTEASARAMVRRILAAESQAAWGWKAAPNWARATGAIALVTGVVAGSAVSFMGPDVDDWSEEATLAESYETLFWSPLDGEDV